MAHITADNVHVDYTIFDQRQVSLRRSLLKFTTGGLIRHDRKNRLVVEALNGVTVHVKDGDRLALLGRNGAGKTTLLRVLAGLCVPTNGSVDSQGRIATLLQVGAGMNPDQSGYDNIVNMGLLLGMSYKQIDTLIPDIEEFTELGEYMSLPVRTYSAGMMVRLSFALVTAINPDILILDESIGAGDAHFVQKAQSRARGLYERSNVMVIASHNLGLVREMCNRAALLDRGKIIMAGDVEAVIDAYSASNMFDKDTVWNIPGHSALPAGATPISDSGGRSASAAFDGCYNTYFVSGLPGKTKGDAAWIGVDYGAAKRAAVESISLHQWNGAGKNSCVTSIRVEASNDKFVDDKTLIAQQNLPPDIALQTITFPAGVQARYWRIVADAPTRDGEDWTIMSMRLNLHESPDMAPCLPDEEIAITPNPSYPTSGALPEQTIALPEIRPGHTFPCVHPNHADDKSCLDCFDTVPGSQLTVAEIRELPCIAEQIRHAAIRISAGDKSVLPAILPLIENNATQFVSEFDSRWLSMLLDIYCNSNMPQERMAAFVAQNFINAERMLQSRRIYEGVAHKGREKTAGNPLENITLWDTISVHREASVELNVEMQRIGRILSPHAAISEIFEKMLEVLCNAPESTPAFFARTFEKDVIGDLFSSYRAGLAMGTADREDTGI